MWRVLSVCSNLNWAILLNYRQYIPDIWVRLVKPKYLKIIYISPPSFSCMPLSKFRNSYYHFVNHKKKDHLLLKSNFPSLSTKCLLSFSEISTYWIGEKACLVCEGLAFKHGEQIWWCCKKARMVAALITPALLRQIQVESLELNNQSAYSN